MIIYGNHRKVFKLVSFLIKGTTGKYFHVEADASDYYDQDFLDLFNTGVQIFMGEPVAKKEPTYSDEWISWSPESRKMRKKPLIDGDVFVDYVMNDDKDNHVYSTARVNEIDWSSDLSWDVQIRAWRVSKNQLRTKS